MGRAKKICGKAGCIELCTTTYCAQHTPAAWANERGNRPHTYALRAMHRQVVVEEPICQCGAPSVVAAHIVARAHGGLDVRANLRGSCHACNHEDLLRDRRQP